MENLKINVYPENDKVLIQTMQLTEHIDKGFNYKLESLQSVIDLVRARGSKEKTFLFYDVKQIQVILDDSKDKRQQDTALYEFTMSDTLWEWQGVVGKEINQKQFIEFLKKRDPEVELTITESLIGSLQTLKLATEIQWAGDYDDNNNYNFAIKVKDFEGNTRLPNAFIVHMPLINESELSMDIEMELEVIKPQGEGQKPLFIITCPKFNRYWKLAVKHEIETLKKALSHYHILAGTK